MSEMTVVAEEQTIARKEIGGMSFARGARGAMSMHGRRRSQSDKAGAAPVARGHAMLTRRESGFSRGSLTVKLPGERAGKTRLLVLDCSNVRCTSSRDPSALTLTPTPPPTHVPTQPRPQPPAPPPSPSPPPPAPSSQLPAPPCPRPGPQLPMPKAMPSCIRCHPLTPPHTPSHPITHPHTPCTPATPLHPRAPPYDPVRPLTGEALVLSISGRRLARQPRG